MHSSLVTVQSTAGTPCAIIIITVIMKVFNLFTSNSKQLINVYLLGHPA